MALTNKLISKQQYDPAHLQKLADLVRIYNEKGDPFDYEIVVDGLKVVRRTSDPEMFFIFENFVTPETKGVEVIFYKGNSNVYEKRIFSFVDEPVSEKGLSGLEVDARIQSEVREQVDREKKELAHQRLAEENASLKKEVEDLEKEVEMLEKEIEKLTGEKSPLQSFLGEFGSSFLESIVRRNPKMLKGLPGGDALAGIIEEDNKLQEQTAQQPEAEVSFKPKEENRTKSDEDLWASLFVNQLKTQFSKEEFDKILIILQTLSEDKAKIDQIITQYQKQ